MVKFPAIPATSFILALMAGTANAQGLSAQFQLGGVFDRASADSFDAAIGFDSRQNYGGNLRLMWSGGNGPWNVEAHSLLSFGAGDLLAYGAAIAPFLPPSEPMTLFDLTGTIYADGETVLTNTIDRLSLSYTGDNIVLRLGRQAVTWGGGTVFHPLDIVGAFAPNAINTSYKTGVDMIYGQYLLDSGADIQAIYVPRPATRGGPVDRDSSTFGVFGSAFIGNLDATLVLAQDRGDFLTGIGLSGPLGGAVWSIEYAHWSLANGDQNASYLVNITNTGNLFGANVFYYAEYFRNGFGVDSGIAFDALPPETLARLARGQIFNTGLDTLALGVQINLTPDITISPNAIISLNASSALIAVQAAWVIDDNADISLGYSQAFGANGTEFGGRETSAGSGVFLRPSTNLSIVFSRFF